MKIIFLLFFVEPRKEKTDSSSNGNNPTMSLQEQHQHHHQQQQQHLNMHMMMQSAMSGDVSQPAVSSMKPERPNSFGPKITKRINFYHGDNCKYF
jgi:hypothetical protein